jgi:hypothetical protein
VRRYLDETSRKPINTFTAIEEIKAVKPVVPAKTVETITPVTRNIRRPKGKLNSKSDRAKEQKTRQGGNGRKELTTYKPPPTRLPAVIPDEVITGDVVLSRPLETFGEYGIKREASHVILDGQTPSMVVYCSANCERESIGLFGAIGNVPDIFKGGRTYELCEWHMRQAALKLSRNYRGAWLKAAVIHNKRPPISGELVAYTGSPEPGSMAATSRRAWEELHHNEPETGSIAYTIHADADDSRIIQAGEIVEFIEEIE